MGCDIHSFAEFKKEGKWIRNEEKIFSEYDDRKTTEPFGWRSYGLFAFLAGVRNYSHIKCIREPRGLPKDSTYLNTKVEDNSSYGTEKSYTTIGKDIWEDYTYHSHSYLTLKELIDFDYEVIIEDRRTTKEIAPNHFSGAEDAGEGNGVKETMREFLGTDFFEHIEVLKTLGEPKDVRIIFYFDN